jgi:basic amino acid/polyamine antiporter, APA family
MPEELKKSLGFPAVFALIVTSMIGTSLFYGVVHGAELAGTSSLFSWILLGAITIYVAACFGELISMFPISGGVYEFTKQTYGRFTSFLVGWVTWIVANVGSAVLVVAALDFVLPGSGAVTFMGFVFQKATVKFAAAIGIILLFNYITYRGAQASGWLLLAFAAIILTLLVALIVPGFNHFNPSHFSDIGNVRPLLILVSMFFLVESFFGWESASFLAEETKDAERTIPKALIWASATVVLIGILLAVMLFGVFPADTMHGEANPVIDLANLIFPAAVPWIIAGVFLTFIGGVISNVVSSPRLLFALARDKLFIEQCTRIHPKYGTPVNAIIFQTVITIVAVVVAFGEYKFLLSILVPLALMMYALVLLCVPLLRKSRPHHPRPFKVWWGQTGPVLVALFYVGIIVSWFYAELPSSISVVTLIIGFVALSFPIYLFLTMVYNPDAIISINNSAARLNYFLEDVLFPKSIRQEILDLFRGHLRGKEVLEFGAGVGTFTMHLAEEVGANGKVIAVDLSRSNLDILEGRAKEKGHLQVHVIHDEHQVNRVHPDIKHVDVIYSIGFLGYVQDLRKVLQEMHIILDHGGRICFVEYTNFFKVLPDPAIVADLRVLESTFREAGFAVSVTKRKGLLWNYLIISGIKTDTKVPYI